LQDRVVIVTGASNGIGRAIAETFAAEGAKTVLVARRAELLDEVAAGIKAKGGEALPLPADLTREDEIAALFAKAVKAYGRLDVLVNNSGVYEFSAIEDLTEQQFNTMFNVNVLGPLLVTQAAVKHLGEGASIINIGSVVSSLTPPNSAVYTGTKGAVDAITGVLAKELGPRKIRVNSINPGMVDTEGVRTAGFIGSDFETGAVAQTPLGRIGQVDDIASVATFLASNDSKWITGELVRVGGGLR